MMTTRSPKVMASTWSWVTNTDVVGISACRRLISMRICARSLASRFDSGSSNRNTCGLRTMQRPSATRCCWPPDRCFGFAASQAGQAEHFSRAIDRRLDLGLRGFPVAQTEGEIVVDAHVLVERVVLKHHRYVAVARRQMVDDALADADLAACGVLEARDHAQCRRLAAARRADQRDELLVGDLQI